MARQVFNILAVAQAGRLQYEAVLLAASLRAMDPDFPGKLFIAEPQPGRLWRSDPRIPEGPTRAFLTDLGVEFLPFEARDFGASYPQGNKIEALAALPEAPFLFLDTDTLITGSFESLRFDFDRPSASMRREGTWPQTELYGPGYGAIWSSLYRRFGLDFESSLDLSQPDEYWKRYLYFNAGWFFHRSPKAFYQRFRDYAVAIRDDAPKELVGQVLDPWLDQVALPLVIHSLGGGRPGGDLAGLDGDVTCHWRTLPLLYAREPNSVVEVLEAVCSPNPVKKVLKESDAFRKMVFQGKGAEVRALFNRADLPRREQMIRNTIKRAGLWVR
ncbi:MAG: hypothetical protein DI533_14745 [Cereibacter sphaeroides]|uniref:Uncharacterized protein n=1 Tax=Cereibacter sphaeroides TaxID=1063 RepID=A0A2W5S2N9_CERSP|nr:MAG: hypothetical protein DI533_14745 [Cereibacter sphaeroides]